jgi:sterol desaturase/sphingolipid hydroxylase (fatty acid hydroxylase superfamily)
MPWVPCLPTLESLADPLHEYYWAAQKVYLSPWFFLGTAAILAIEVLRPAIRRQRLLSRAFLEDFLWFNLDLGFRAGIFPLFVAGTAFLYNRVTGGYAIPLLARLPVAWQVVLSFLALDLLGWLHHWIRHKVPPLWQFHVLHHSQRDLNLFTDFRVHTVEHLIAHSISVAPLLAFGLNPYSVIGVKIGIMWYTRVIHANIRSTFGPLRYVLVTPQSHRIHHSIEPQHWDRNFGVVLCVWDRLFGTHWPGTEEYPETGVVGVELGTRKHHSLKEIPLAVWREFCYPFRRLAAGGFNTRAGRPAQPPATDRERSRSTVAPGVSTVAE